MNNSRKRDLAQKEDKLPWDKNLWVLFESVLCARGDTLEDPSRPDVRLLLCGNALASADGSGFASKVSFLWASQHVEAKCTMWWLVFSFGSVAFGLLPKMYICRAFSFPGCPAVNSYCYNQHFAFFPCSSMYSVYSGGNDVYCLEILWPICFSSFLHIIIWRHAVFTNGKPRSMCRTWGRVLEAMWNVVEISTSN